MGARAMADSDMAEVDNDWRMHTAAATAARPAFTVPESLAQMAERYLEAEIIEGRLAAGTRLNPEEIARQLNISKSPVREAMILLQREGLVTGKPRSVFIVSEIDLADIEEIYPIRASLNGLVVKSVMRSAAAAAIVASLGKCLEKMKPVVEAGDSLEYFHLSVDFYNLLVAACPNRRLSSMWNQLSKQVLRFRFLVMSQPGHIKRSFKDHRALLAAMRGKDVEAAMRCAEDIIYSSLEVLVDVLGKEKQDATK